MLPTVVTTAELLASINAGTEHTTALKQALVKISAALQVRFEQGEDIHSLMQARANNVDQVIGCLWQLQDLHHTDCQLFAVGGYGRGELHPHSDIDLLILVEDTETIPPALQQFLTSLWDISLNIGHSVRTLKQTVELAKEDLTVVTSLMEIRRLEGSESTLNTLTAAIAPDNVWPAQPFYGRKWEEQIIRHKKFANTEYSLEPNIKDGPGGLRDIQILRWIALRKFDTADFRELQQSGVITVDEVNSLTESERFVQSLRWSLHMLAGREEDRLLFDHQRELAAQAGYQDSDEGLAVEQFMQRYYRHSMNISSLNELLMQAFEETVWDTFSVSVPQVLNERFQLRSSHIEPIKGDALFYTEPSALLEVFTILAEDGQIAGMTVSCIRGILRAKNLIDEEFRADLKNRKLFVRLMSSGQKLTSQLRRMNQLGILALYLPEWAGIVGRMQHDLFHIYTVDAHSINVVKNMRMLTYEGGTQAFPLAYEVIRRLPKLDLLYTAGLFHDIAKGRGGDHSELGAVDAQRYCQNHGYNEQETALVAWLVANHLLMSSTAQRKDISDPEEIRNFALTVGNENYLDYLFVLTVADINATNPTLWTSWRASLLRQLYTETRRALRRGLEKESQRDEWIASTRRLALQLLTETSYTEEEILPQWDTLVDDYFLRETASDIAWHSEAMLNHDSGPLVLIKDSNNRRFEGATQIFVYTPKHASLFANITALMAQMNLSVQDARIYNAPGGYSMDTYFVLDADNQPIPNTNGEHSLIKNRLEDGLRADEQTLSTRKIIPRALKHFSTPTSVHHFNAPNDTHTVLEVSSPDRPGMLAIVADILNRFDIALTGAKITTLGDRVEDVLYICTAEGTAVTDQARLTTLADTIKHELDQQNSDESGLTQVTPLSI